MKGWKISPDGLIVSIPYWEAFYRRDFADNGRRVVSFGENTLPNVVKRFAHKGRLLVPIETAYQKAFSPFEWYKVLNW
jgi:hypothetical protein